ncbi:ABC transporter [Mycena pura]|uniref:ABC transporter n=1 Tax=Mycena pura TaxID=153505 RepID=A0AAD6UL14_9AGAR|nr:ABC transporter [Mycena pura]
MSPHGTVKSARGSANHTLAVPGVPSLSRAHKVINPAASDPVTIVTGAKLALVFVAILLSQLLTALDQTILGTALPRIASDFRAFSLQGWVSTSFVLSQTVFTLLFGQMVRIFAAKWILIASIVVFEIGSVLCSVSQNVHQLIAGRTIAGVGAAGMFIGMLQVVAQVTRLEDRARLYGLFGANFALSSVIGPLIGGALTDKVTWRWCFYMNLPLGAVSVTGVMFLLKALPPLGSDPTQRSPWEILRQTLRLDFLGVILAAGSVTCLILALQWGGNIKPWGDKEVIICFVMAFVLGAVYVAWEVYMGERAMTPTAIYKSRSVWAILAYCFLTRFSFLIYSYYIPIFYQAALHHSAIKSGIDLLPFMLSLVLTIITIGQIVGKTGYLWPFLLVGPFFLATGSGLLYTLSTSSSSAQLVGFQILAGVGTAMGMQNSILAMQVEFRDAPTLIGQATSMGCFAQFLGGTLGLGVAEPVFASELAKYLLIYAPDAPTEIVKESPTAIYTALPAAMISGVIRSYIQALRVVFLLGVPVAGLALLSVFFMHNLKVEKAKVPPVAEEAHTENITDEASK